MKDDTAEDSVDEKSNTYPDTFQDILQSLIEMTFCDLLSVCMYMIKLLVLQIDKIVGKTCQSWESLVYR